MSAVLVIHPDLRERVANELAQMAAEYPRSSLAADVLPEYLNEVIDGVCELIDLDCGHEIDCCVIAALGRWKMKNRHQFVRRAAKPNGMTINGKRTRI